MTNLITIMNNHPSVEAALCSLNVSQNMKPKVGWVPFRPTTGWRNHISKTDARDNALLGRRRVTDTFASDSVDATMFSRKGLENDGSVQQRQRSGRCQGSYFYARVVDLFSDSRGGSQRKNAFFAVSW